MSEARADDIKKKESTPDGLQTEQDKGAVLGCGSISKSDLCHPSITHILPPSVCPSQLQHMHQKVIKIEAKAIRPRIKSTFLEKHAYIFLFLPSRFMKTERRKDRLYLQRSFRHQKKKRWLMKQNLSCSILHAKYNSALQII